MLDTDALKRRIHERGLSQAEVARVCGMTQPHLSKILSKRIKPGRKAVLALLAWSGAVEDSSLEDQLENIARRIRAASPQKRMHAMQFLSSFERLL